MALKSMTHYPQTAEPTLSVLLTFIRQVKHFKIKWFWVLAYFHTLSHQSIHDNAM